MSDFYVLVCRECGDGDDAVAMPFSSPEERGKWAAAHTRGTGHDRWLCDDCGWASDEAVSDV